MFFIDSPKDLFPGRNKKANVTSLQDISFTCNISGKEAHLGATSALQALWHQTR